MKSIASLVIAVELRPGVEFPAELVAAPDKKLWFASAYSYLPDLDACDIARAVCAGATAGRCGKYNWRVSSVKWA